MTKFLDMPNAGQSIRIYQDSQPCIGILTSGVFSKHVKNIVILAHCVYRTVDSENIPPALQPADPVTRSISAPLLFHAYDYATWVCFYPWQILSMLNSWTSLSTTPLVPSSFLFHSLVDLTLFGQLLC